MKKSSNEIRKEMKIEFLKKFFGEDLKMKSNKYFTFNNIIDDDNIIIITNNIKMIKDNMVLIVDNNKAVYLKHFQIYKIHNFYENINTNAIKLNRNFFKVYTFKNQIDPNITFEKEQTFDDLKEIAKSQANQYKWAVGHMYDD